MDNELNFNTCRDLHPIAATIKKSAKKDLTLILACLLYTSDAADE